MAGEELGEALKELVGTAGVNASAVITRNGVMVEFRNRHIMETVSSLSVVVAMMVRTAEKCIKILNMGDMDELRVKADGGTVVAERCEGFILLVAVDKGIDYDTIKPKIERIKSIIRGM